jgi:hypothetical protein
MPSDLCGSDFVHMVGSNSFFGEKRFMNSQLYVIYLINVMVVILETHAKCH